MQEVGTVGRRKKQNTGNSGIAGERALRQKGLPRPYGMGLKRQPVEMLWKTTMFFGQAANTPRAGLANLFDDEGEEIIPRALPRLELVPGIRAE